MSETYMLAALEKVVRSRGIDIHGLEVDSLNPQALEPVEYREQPRVLGYGTFEAPFYRIMLRWRIGKNGRGLMLIDPVIKRESSGYYRIDYQEMGNQFLKEVTRTYAVAEEGR